MSFYSSHSADVQMWLDCGEHGLVPLGRITPKSVVAKSSHNIPLCFADLVVTVDGLLIRSRVNRATGFSRSRRAALVYPVDDSAPF